METLTEKYTRFLDEIEKTDELLTYKEWSLIQEDRFRELEPAKRKWIKYGLASIIGGALGKATGMSYSGVPLATWLLYMYRTYTDTCVRRCGGIKHKQKSSKCYNTCYMNASKAALDRVKSDRAQLRKIPDAEKRRIMAVKLKKQEIKYRNKYDTYKLRATTGPQEVVLRKKKKVIGDKK